MRHAEFAYQNEDVLSALLTDVFLYMQRCGGAARTTVTVDGEKLQRLI